MKIELNRMVFRAENRSRLTIIGVARESGVQVMQNFMDKLQMLSMAPRKQVYVGFNENLNNFSD